MSLKGLAKGAKNTAKTAGEMAKKGIKAAQKGIQATQVAKQALENPATTIFNLLFSPLVFPPGANPFNTKDVSSTPKLVVNIIRTISTIITYLMPFIKIIAVAAIIILILYLVGVLGISTSSNQQLTVSGPIFAKIGDKLDYTISVNYSGSAQNIIITNQIPDGTEYLSAPQGNYDPVTNTVAWNIPAATGSVSAALSLTLLATKDNNYITNIIRGTIPNGVLGENDSLVSSNKDQILTPQLPPMTYPLTPKFNTPNATPTVFQLAPTNIPVSPQDTNIIKSCVVTKVGEPVIIPSLPPECTDF